MFLDGPRRDTGLCPRLRRRCWSWCARRIALLHNRFAGRAAGPFNLWCRRGPVVLNRSLLIDPPGDRFKPRLQALLERGSHLVFQPAGVRNGSPVDTAHPHRRMFAVKDQAGEVGLYVLQGPPGDKRCDADIAEVGNLTLKMK